MLACFLIHCTVTPLGKGGMSRVLGLTAGVFLFVFNQDRNVLCNITAFGKKVFSAATPEGISETYVKKTKKATNSQLLLNWSAQFTSGGLVSLIF